MKMIVKSAAVIIPKLGMWKIIVESCKLKKSPALIFTNQKPLSNQILKLPLNSHVSM